VAEICLTGVLAKIVHSKSADVIDDSDEELERLDRLEEERLRLSKAVLTDGENEGKNSANEDVEMA
jgi:hypothetical protein